MDPLLYQKLTQIGLHEREAKIYLALLELSESGAYALSKKAAIQRTYVYDILDALVKRGLATQYEKDGKKTFRAEPPTTIERILTQRVHDFRSLLPELLSIHNLAPNKPKVRFYEGKEGAMTVYDEMMTEPWYDNIGEPDAFLEAMGPDYALELGKRIVAHKIRTRELFTLPKQPLLHNATYDPKYQEIRFLPEGVRVNTDLCIGENKAYFISFDSQMHTVVIEGSGIVKTLRTMFELLWQITEKHSEKTN